MSNEIFFLILDTLKLEIRRNVTGSNVKIYNGLTFEIHV